MKSRLMMILAAGLILSFAAPSQATFWYSSSHRDYRWSQQTTQNDCDWSSWFDNCDSGQWDGWGDWCDDWDQNWDCGNNEPQDNPCDNPVPEPATAGLAVMSLAALTSATRRRRK